MIDLREELERLVERDARYQRSQAIEFALDLLRERARAHASRAQTEIGNRRRQDEAEKYRALFAAVEALKEAYAQWEDRKAIDRAARYRLLGGGS